MKKNILFFFLFVFPILVHSQYYKGPIKLLETNHPEIYHPIFEESKNFEDIYYQHKPPFNSSDSIYQKTTKLIQASTLEHKLDLAEQADNLEIHFVKIKLVSFPEKQIRYCDEVAIFSQQYDLEVIYIDYHYWTMISEFSKIQLLIDLLLLRENRRNKHVPIDLTKHCRSLRVKEKQSFYP